MHQRRVGRPSANCDGSLDQTGRLGERHVHALLEGPSDFEGARRLERTRGRRMMTHIPAEDEKGAAVKSWANAAASRDQTHPSLVPGLQQIAQAVVGTIHHFPSRRLSCSSSCGWTMAGRNDIGGDPSRGRFRWMEDVVRGNFWSSSKEPASKEVMRVGLGTALGCMGTRKAAWPLRATTDVGPGLMPRVRVYAVSGRSGICLFCFWKQRSAAFRLGRWLMEAFDPLTLEVTPGVWWPQQVVVGKYKRNKRTE